MATPTASSFAPVADGIRSAGSVATDSPSEQTPANAADRRCRIACLVVPCTDYAILARGMQSVRATSCAGAVGGRGGGRESTPFRQMRILRSHTRHPSGMSDFHTRQTGRQGHLGTGIVSSQRIVPDSQLTVEAVLREARPLWLAAAIQQRSLGANARRLALVDACRLNLPAFRERPATLNRRGRDV